MKIIYDDAFDISTDTDDNIGLPGRMKAAMDGFRNPGSQDSFEIVVPKAASMEQLLLAHSEEYLAHVAANEKLLAVASLAAGGAILAGESAFKGIPSFACIRPPGHHASRDNAWGHCTFNNIAVALLVLRNQKRIRSAFLLDFDAHTGDGTRNILEEWKEAVVFNPFAESAEEYIAIIEQRLTCMDASDVFAVSAGFDLYIHDVGRKLGTLDFKRIGQLVGWAAKRRCGGRRFAVLEGGYYLPDLGMNVRSFCDGFSA